MKYWVLKARPSGYDYAAKLRPGREVNWKNVPASSEQDVGDRVFLWASSPARRVAGLGVVVEPTGKYLRVHYLTAQLAQMPKISFLKTNTALNGATFLQAGRYGTAFPLTLEQAKALYRVVTTQNPSAYLWSDWPKGPDIDDIEAGEFEGRPKLVTHLHRERKPQLAKKKKADFGRKHGGIFCEACRRDYTNYGHLVDDIFEVHHRRPISESTGLVKTLLKDLAVLCPNCHRAIHRTDPMLSVEALAKRLQRKSAK
ncbi:MAG: HNH endonuclease [Opitutaceae bacterium]|nr:HNH endonuclease [Opitutaceae bacterium]